MGLFEKKYCDICGDKISFMGNRKLSDGKMCKSCEGKLSPWFSERRQSSLSEIKEQIDYREANKDAVAAFNTTRSLGTNMKILFDEDNRKFMVTSARNLQEANPDVMDYSQITGCRLDIEEDKSEMTGEDVDGETKGYNPPQYSYDYDFYMIINVNNPYFNEIRFKLNNTDVTIEPVIRVADTATRSVSPASQVTTSNQAVKTSAYKGIPQPQAPQPKSFTAQPQAKPVQPTQAKQIPGRPVPPQPQGRPVPPQPKTVQPQGRPVPPQPKTVQPQARPVQPQARPVQPQPAQVQTNTKIRVISSTMIKPEESAEYMKYKNMGDEIIEILTGVRQEVRDSIAAANEPVKAVVCPYCGATTIPDALGCCEYCGGAIG